MTDHKVRGLRWSEVPLAVSEGATLGYSQKWIRRTQDAEKFLAWFDAEIARNGLRFVIGSDFGPGLERTPLAAVEIIEKWARRDIRAALDAAVALVEGRYTVRSLAKAELRHRVRTSRDLELDGRLQQAPFRERLVAAIEQQVAEEVRQPPWPSGAAPLDVMIGTKLGVVFVGPYREASHYSSRAHDWCFRVTGIARVARVPVLLLVLSPTHHDRYAEFFRRNEISEVRVASCEPNIDGEDLWRSVAPVIEEIVGRNAGAQQG